MALTTANSRRPSVEMVRFGERIEAHFAGTSDTYRRMIRAALKRLARVGVGSTADIDEVAVQRVLSLGAGLAVNTRRDRYAALHAMLDQAVELGLLPVMPQFPPKPREDPAAIERRLSEGLTVPDVEYFLRYLREEIADWGDHREFAMVATGCLAGLYQGELLALEKEHIDFAKGTISVNRRHWLQREIDSPPPIVKMSELLERILREWLQRVQCEWVFPGDKQKGPCTRGGNTGREQVQRIKAKASDAGLTKSVDFLAFRRFYRKFGWVEISLPDCPLKLRSWHDPAEAFGEQGAFHTVKEFQVVRALVRHSPSRLTLEELKNSSKVHSVKRIIPEMQRREEFWRRIIDKTGDGNSWSRPTYGLSLIPRSPE